MRIGLIADTHGYLGEDAMAALMGCDHIVHAGDVGSGVLSRLASIAPVTAVRGNNDRVGLEAELPLIAWLEVGCEAAAWSLHPDTPCAPKTGHRASATPLTLSPSPPAGGEGGRRRRRLAGQSAATDGHIDGLRGRPTDSVDLGRVRLAVVHRLIDAPVDGWDVLVFGHCHRVHADRDGERLLINPGAAGRRGFHARRSVAVLTIDGEVACELIDLGLRGTT